MKKIINWVVFGLLLITTITLGVLRIQNPKTFALDFAFIAVVTLDLLFATVLLLFLDEATVEQDSTGFFAIFYAIARPFKQKTTTACIIFRIIGVITFCAIIACIAAYVFAAYYDQELTFYIAGGIAIVGFVAMASSFVLSMLNKTEA